MNSVTEHRGIIGALILCVLVTGSIVFLTSREQAINNPSIPSVSGSVYHYEDANTPITRVRVRTVRFFASGEPHFVIGKQERYTR